MYYTHSGYQTSVFGKNCAYYIQIFTVLLTLKNKNINNYEELNVAVTHLQNSHGKLMN